MSTLHRNRRESSLCLLILILCMIGGCQALDNDTKKYILIPLPIVLFAVVVGVICICFWACYCNVSRQFKQPTTIRRTYYPPNQPAVDNVDQPHNNSDSVQTYSCTTTPTEPESNLQIDTLPEAKLHQGDAPPAYAEAVKMTTVVIMDE